MKKTEEGYLLNADEFSMMVYCLSWLHDEPPYLAPFRSDATRVKIELMMLEASGLQKQVGQAD